MKTMTKLLNLGEVSVQANIAQLCYAVAKMTINLMSPIVISVKSNATQSRYVGARTMTHFKNKTIAAVEIS